MLLPADMDITERSRKFYDGTYKLVADGFTDELGGKCSNLGSSDRMADTM